ncbi:hypothetical protein COT75_04660 [Candidatus Beckwithbacteria bacterium CG10_big_fil_rev_8_21_14_0_10_34_10]|uniref:Glycosyl hydrolases family 39 N-terminal catalytic domain-containing protein n=1 Tax=Candidatus Beckwithbacteria bacterium CG10_big_fil_rev_8_21_14_0_10_34_10 TaxID=1974495 RepID=A0A2H0W854_9BACT|nr:MAG: hypothetical protein COT75_04660 [Candidatus Beckwithbacteria bacterium CG10_big_fil_rev_8_21_14_0_10_34_10]
MINKEKIIISFFTLIILFLFVPFYLIEKEVKVRIPETYLARPFQPADIIVNIQRNYGSIPRTWRALAQGGEEASGARMIEATVNQVKKLQLDYIRLDHIYDDDYYGVVKGRSGGKLDLDWSKLDETVDDIKATGAKPFFSLTYLPEEVGPGKIGKPNNWADWQDLVRQTIEHYSKDTEEIYYEVWNEPSLEWFGGWKMYGEKNYLELYKYSVLGALQAQGVKPFKIGGPSIPELDPVWIRLLYDYVLANNLRLDFVSWHRYSFLPEVFLNDVYQINVIESQPKYKKFQNTEKLLTEWGPNSEKDTAYSSSIAASHAVHILRKLLDKTKYCFAFEVKDGPNQGQEAWGLLTHELTEGGVKEKPRYLLYDWLAEFEGNRVEVLGEGTQITGFAVFDNRTTILILSNYQAQNPFEESFNISFGGIKDGQYRLFIQELFSQPEEKQVTVKGGSIVLNQNLKPYQVLRVKLTKLSS